MLNYLADTDTLIPVPLTLNGEPFVPDDGVVTWELRGHSGAVVSPAASLPGVTDTTAMITLSAALLGLVGGTQEKRTLVVTGLNAGFPFRITVPFRITGFLNISVTEKDVRRFIGVNEGELRDEEIDLVEAYFDVAGRTGIDLPTALTGPEKADRAANKAIVAQTVLNLMPALPQLLTLSETDGTSDVKRFPVDFQLLESKAAAQLDAALAVITTNTAGERTLIVLTERTDPITGA